MTLLTHCGPWTLRQIKALSEQLRDATAGDDTQRATISQQTDEIRTLKTELRQALETIERTKVDMERSKSSVSTELAELRERVSYLRTHLEAEEGKARAQRDEMEDTKRAHRSELGDMEDEVRRLKSQLADAHAREARLAPAQQRADDLAQQVMAISQEAKALTLENGRLAAENARLTQRRAAEDSESDVAHRSSGNTLARAQETIKQLEMDLAAARAEAAQARLDCEKMKVGLGDRLLEVAVRSVITIFHILFCLSVGVSWRWGSGPRRWSRRWRIPRPWRRGKSSWPGP